MKLLAFLSLCLIWGTSWIGIKFALEGFPPFLGAAARFGLAVLFLFLYARANRVSLRIGREIYGLILLCAALNYAIDYGLIYWGEQYLSAGVTAIFFATFPLFTAVFSGFFLPRERLRWPIGFALAAGFAGVALTFYQEFVDTRFDSRVTWATAAVVVSAMAGALSNIVIKRRLGKVHPIPLSLHQMLWGVLMLAAVGVLRGETALLHPGMRAILATVYLGLVASALAFSLYYWLLQNMNVVRLSLIVYIFPVVALLVDWLVVGRSIALRTVAGMALIFTGIAFSEFYSSRRPPL